MVSSRNVSVVLSAKVDRYTSDMAAAADATRQVGQEADKAQSSVESANKGMASSSKQVEQAAKQVTDARRKEEDAAARLNTAEHKLADVKANSKSTAAQVAKAEQDVTTSRNQLEKATETLTDAEKKHAQAAGQAGKGFDGLAKSIKDNRSEMDQVGRTMTIFGGSIVAAGAAATHAGIEFNSLKQTSKAALTTVMGSARDASKQMDKLNEFGQDSWVMRDVLIRAQQQMTGFGVETKKVIPYLDGLQEAVAAAGGDSQTFEELAGVMAKVKAEGKLTATTFREFGTRGVDAASLIGEAMGKTGQEIRDEVTNGSLDADMALDALAEGMKTKFDGATENLRNTFRGAVDDAMASWRDLSATIAEPLVGPDGGGILVSGLNVLSDTMQDVTKRAEEMPDAVKTAGLAIGGTAGGVSLAAGGFLLLAPRILDTVEAYKKLSGASGILGKTSRAMGKVGKAAGIAAGAFVALELAAASYNAISMKPAVQGIEDITNELLRASEGGDAAADVLDGLFKGKDGEGLTKDVDDLGTAIDDVMYKGDGFNEWINKNLGGDAINEALGTVGKAETQFRDLDEAMAGLVSSGSAEEAADLFGQVAQKFEDQGYAAQDAMDFFPELRKEYQGIANELKVSVSETELFNWMLSGEMPPAVQAAAEATGEGSDAIKGMGDEADTTTDALKNMLDGLFELGLATLSEREAMRRYEAAIDDVGESIKENGRSLDITTEKGRNNEEALDAIADAGFRAADSMAENGASQEQIQEHLERTRDDLIEAANKFGLTGDKAEDLADKVLGIPPGVSIETWMSDAAKDTAIETGDEIEAVGQMEPKPKIDADNSDASEKIEDTKDDLENIPDKTIWVRIKSWWDDLWNDDGKPKKSRSKQGATNPDRLHNYYGNILTPMAAGGFTGAEMVRPNTWRVVGDRMDVDEAYIPLDGSKRSWQIMLESLQRMPGDSPLMAAGGIVGRAEARLAEAQKHLDAVSNRGRKRTAEDRKRDAAQTRVDQARDALTRAKEMQARKDRVADLQDTLRTDVRRGRITDQVTGSLSGGYSAVDRLFNLGENEDLSRGSRSKATSAARRFEANLKNLYAQADKLDSKLKKAQDRAKELNGIKDSVVNSLLGERGLDVGTFQTRGVDGAWQSHSDLGQAAKGLRSDVAGMKEFAGKLKRLAEMGIPGAIIQEIAQAGVAEGSNMADSFLDATAAERKSYLSAWSDYEKYANQAGQYVTEGFYSGGAAAADGIVKGLEGEQKSVEAAIAKLAKAMESTFKQVLGIHSPSKVTEEIGNFTVEGLVKSMLGGVGDVQSAAQALGAAAVPAAVPNAMAFDVTATPIVDTDEALANQAMADMSSVTMDAMFSMRDAVAQGWASMMDTTRHSQEDMSESTRHSQEDMTESTRHSQEDMTESTRRGQRGMDETIRSSQKRMSESTRSNQGAMLTTTRDRQESMLKTTRDRQESMRSTTAAKQQATREKLTSEQDQMRATMADRQRRMRDQSATDFESIRSTTGRKLGTMRSESSTTMTGLRTDYSGHLSRTRELNRSGFESMRRTADTNVRGIRAGMDREMKGARPELGGNLNALIGVFGSFTKSVNKAFGDVGVKLDPPARLKYAEGGTLPGYSPGYDNIRYYSPVAGELHLSGGESIMRPEWTRAMGGPAGIKAQNDAARQGRLEDLYHMQTNMFARGGVYGQVPGVNSFADSGVWRNLWAMTKAQFPGAVLTSSYRPGSITASNNLSHHARGNAIDVSPSMDIFNWWRSNYGANLAELIYSPAGGKQIKNGRNHYYTGAVRSMHYNHVHIAAVRALSEAMAGGLPGAGGAFSHPFLERAGVKPGADMSKSYAKAAEKLYAKIYAKHADQLPDGIGGQLGRGIMDQIRKGLVDKATKYGKTAGSMDFSGVASGPIKTMAKDMLEQMGWGDQFGDLDWLLTRESGWRPNAQNPTSTAYGLFQFLNSTWGTVGGSKTSDPKKQLEYGLKYIKQRYGDVRGARAFWQRNNWYKGGAKAAQSGLAVVGEDGPELINLKGGERVHNAPETRRMLAEHRTFIPNQAAQGVSGQQIADAVAASVQANQLSPQQLAKALDGVQMTFQADGQQFTGAVHAAVGSGYDQSVSRLSKSSKKIGAR